MKILVISTLYPPNGIGGAETTAHLLARRFVDWGHEVVSASLAPDGLARTLTVDGVRCRYVPLANLFWPHASPRPQVARRTLWHLVDAFNPVMARRLGRILDREKPDVVHAHNLQGFSVAAWWAAHGRGIPVVQTLHDYYLACPRSVMFRDGRNCDGRCLPCRPARGPRAAFSHLPHTVTAVSRRVLDRVTATGVLARVPRRVVIRGCNEVAAAALPAGAAAAERRRDGSGAIRVGYIGRLDPLKGIETLVEAGRLLPSTSFTVSIAGSGAPDYVDALRAADLPPHVRFVGFVRPADFFGGIDVLVVPSIWEEPGARVIHEAYAHGVPVVASRLGGSPEMVVEGRTGYLFEPGNARALAAALDRARRAGVGAGAMARACREESARYDPDKIAGEYMAVLATAAREGKRTCDHRCPGATSGQGKAATRIGSAAQRVPPARSG